MNKEKTNENGTKQAPGNGFAITLLETGRHAFPEIISQIRSAGQEIILHMFIWREDRIGLEIAGELLRSKKTAMGCCWSTGRNLSGLSVTVLIYGNGFR